MDRNTLEPCWARDSRLPRSDGRAGVHESTVAYWVARYGLRAGGAEKHAARGGIGREELQELVDGGLSIAEISAEVGRSKATVRHWLRDVTG